MCRQKYWRLVKKGERFYYRIKILGLVRDLPLFTVAPGVRIAIFNILGDTQLIKRVGAALAKKLPPADLLLTAEVKSVPLVYELARRLKLPYVVLRKIIKPYMLGAVKTRVVTITTGRPQELWLDGKDRQLLKGKRVIIVDDVISTGATLLGMRKLARKAGGIIVAEAAVFTEGEENKWPKVIALGNLPIFPERQDHTAPGAERRRGGE